MESPAAPFKWERFPPMEFIWRPRSSFGQYGASDCDEPRQCFQICQRECDGYERYFDFLNTECGECGAWGQASAAGNRAESRAAGYRGALEPVRSRVSYLLRCRGRKRDIYGTANPARFGGRESDSNQRGGFDEAEHGQTNDHQSFHVAVVCARHGWGGSKQHADRNAYSGGRFQSESGAFLVARGEGLYRKRFR